MKFTDVSKIVGRNIRELRSKENMKGETLAKELGVTKACISQMENGVTDIKVSTLHQIATIFKTDVCSLISSETVHSVKQFQNITSPEKTVLIDTAVVERLLLKIDNLNQHVANLSSPPGV